MTVLLYCHDPILCSLIQSAVQRVGGGEINLITTATSEQAERICSFTDIHLLFCCLDEDSDAAMRFAEQARNQDPNLKILLISDTPRLEYALCAIRIHCLDYLYGPYSEKQLSDSVMPAVQSCRIELWKEQLSVYKENHYSPLRNRHAEETLRDMFSESCTQQGFVACLEDLQKWVPALDLTQTYQMVLVYLPPLQEKTPPWDIDSLRFAVRSTAEKLFLAGDNNLPLLLQRHSIYLFPTHTPYTPELAATAEQFRQECRALFDLDLSVLISEPLPFSQLKPASIQLERELRQLLSASSHETISEQLKKLTESSPTAQTPTTLSRSLYLSPAYLARVYKNETGECLSDYLRRIRINRICSELLFSDKSISQIALDQGFSNFSNFSSYFRKATGLTPTAYRKQIPGQADSSAPSAAR